MGCKYIFLVFSLITLSLLFLVSAAQNETTQLEVNIFAKQTQSAISIEVPDYIFLGDVNESKATNKIQVYINNTGTTNITIFPQLKLSHNTIFENLYFQNRKSGSNSVVYQIGNYSFRIAKPSTGGKRSEYFWMWLDLSNYQEDITQDLIGLKEDLNFIALEE